MQLFATGFDISQNILGSVIVLNVLKALRDHIFGQRRAAAPGFSGKPIQPIFQFRRQFDCE
jgi:hypothetical protein